MTNSDAVCTVDANKRNKNLTFKNNVPFISCISKINNTFVDNAEDRDIVMPMYNLLEYNDNYSVTSRSLWNYYRDYVNDDANENNNAGNYRINNEKTTASRPFQCKTKIGSTPADNDILEAKVVLPLKYLRIFWRFLDFPLINYKIELDLSWSKECMILEIHRILDIPNLHIAPTRATGTIFQTRIFKF